MPIEPKFTRADVKNRYDAFIEAIVRRQIERMQYLGEMCITHARTIPPEVGFHDVTGNLRASMGYMVFVNGIAVRDNYPGGSAEGVARGRELAKKIGSTYTSGIVLVVTAGMNYAVAVESRGRDVLTSAEVMAKQELPRMIEELKRNINNAVR